MRLFAAGLFTETNTFSPVPTGTEDFLVHRSSSGGSEARSIPGCAQIGIWRAKAAARGDEFIFSLMAFAEPAGLTLRATYEDLRDEILRDLQRALPVDIVLLNLHGAMVAEGYDDCEADLLHRVRALVGPSTIVCAELDLHCLLSDEMVTAADLLITYKEYPHTDINERAEELFNLAVLASLRRIKPEMAVFDCRMIGLYPTSIDPLRELVASLRATEAKEVLSISFAHGFPFSDVPYSSAKVLVVTNTDRTLAVELAQRIGLQFYRRRREIGFDARSVPMDEALKRALSHPQKPIVLADQSDNPGSGAPGDATFALRWLLAEKAQDVALGIFYDPEVVTLASKVGAGKALQVRLGGKTGPLSGDPVDLCVTVQAVIREYVHEFPQKTGPAWTFPAGNVVALQAGTLHIVVSSRRCQCFSPSIFTDLGIDPLQKQLLIPKSIQHFVGAFEPIAAEIVYMDGPGAVSPNPKHIAYQRLDTTRLFPWQDDPLAQD